MRLKVRQFRDLYNDRLVVYFNHYPKKLELFSYLLEVERTRHYCKPPSFRWGI